MKFLKRRIEVIEQAPEILFDRALGQSRVEAFRDAVMTEEYPAATAIFESCDNWNERQHMIEVISHIEGRPEQIEKWPEREPGRPLPLLVRGAQGNAWAWSVRGAKTRVPDNKESWDTFLSRLKQAQADLRVVGWMVPTDALSKLALLRSAKALGTPYGDLVAQFEQIQRLAPTMFAAYSEFLQCSTAKWAGSHDQMFGFARRISEVSPDSSPLHGLVPIAHLEWCLLQPNLSPHEYFTDAVKDEIHAAAQRSVLSRDFFRTTDFRPKIAVLNIFALAAFFCDEHTLTGQLMNILDDNLLSEFPWTYFDEDPLVRYRRFRTINQDLLDRGRTGDWI